MKNLEIHLLCTFQFKSISLVLQFIITLKRKGPSAVKTKKLLQTDNWGSDGSLIVRYVDSIQADRGKVTKNIIRICILAFHIRRIVNFKII